MDKATKQHMQSIAAQLATNDDVAELVFDHIPADMPAGYSTLIGRAYFKNDAAEVMRLVGELISKGLEYEAEKAALDESDYLDSAAGQQAMKEADRQFAKYGVHA